MNGDGNYLHGFLRRKVFLYLVPLVQYGVNKVVSHKLSEYHFIKEPRLSHSSAAAW